MGFVNANEGELQRGQAFAGFPCSRVSDEEYYSSFVGRICSSYTCYFLNGDDDCNDGGGVVSVATIAM